VMPSISLIPLLLAACLAALASVAALGWALAPFVGAVLRAGTAAQKGAVGALVVLAAAEAGFFAWMALSF
jgi:hypothetical protein